MEFTNKQILEVLTLFNWCCNKYDGKTHLGPNAISKKMGYEHGNREPGRQLLLALKTLNVIELVGYEANPYPEGVESYGHNPDIDYHSEIRPFYKRGKNWDYFFASLKRVV